MSIRSTPRCSFSRCALIVCALIAPLFLPQPVRAQAQGEIDKSKEIRDFVATIVATKKIPGMTAAIADAEGVVAIGSAGVRKADANARFADGDLVHIGSCTKAITCTMLAALVADGTLTWNTKLIDVFPELKNDIHPDYQHATLWQLVTHRARIPANARNWWAHGKTDIRRRRLAILTDNLKEAPKTTPGEYHYSNLGYMVAGCMAEALCDSTWESLMKNRVFKPLGMTSAGFGAPGTPEKVDQPWGHIKSQGEWQPKQLDNAAALGPAGRVHCTLDDWAKFISLQLPRNNKPPIDRQHLQKLIEPSGDYAGGWGVVQRPWAKGLALTHCGSNTMWYATVWVAPGLNRAFMVATNSCDENSHSVCDQVISRLIAIDRGNPD